MLIDIIDSEEGTGEGGGLAESDEEGCVDLALRVNEDAAEEEDEASDGKDSCSEQLYVEFLFHFECKGNIKKRTRQKSGLGKRDIVTF